MARAIQRQVDGVAVDEYRARFKGTVVLEEPELPSTAFDEVGVYIVVARCDEVQMKQDKKGNVYRIAALTATDARVAEGELKTILVERLGLYGDDTVDPPTLSDNLPDAAPVGGSQLQFDLGAVIADTGEIVDEIGEQEFADVTDGVDGVIGSIHQRSPEAAAEGRGGGALKTVPFRLDSDASETAPDVDTLNERVTVGRIRQSKDPALQRFIEDGR
jgi:hypothetical protein